MNSRNAEINVHVCVAWWLIPYLKVVRLLCECMGTEPDMHRINRVVNRAIRTRIDHG